MPETLELKIIRDNYNQKGYMTGDEVERLNRMHEDHIKSLRNNERSKKGIDHQSNSPKE